MAVPTKEWMTQQLDLGVVRREILKYWDIVEITNGDINIINTIRKLEAENEQLKRELDQLEADNTQLKQELAQLKECKVHADQLEAENTQLKRELAQLKKECTFYKDEMKKDNKKLKDCEKKLKDCEKKWKDCEKKLKDCEKQLKCCKNKPPRTVVITQYCTTIVQNYVYIPCQQVYYGCRNWCRRWW